jgi:hypothetical protein
LFGLEHRDSVRLYTSDNDQDNTFKYKTAGDFIWKYEVPRKIIKIGNYEYKTLPGFSNYYFTNCGKVYSIKHKIFVKSSVPCKRHRISLQHDENGNRSYILHRLIAQAWIPNLCNGKNVLHKSIDYNDNSVDNLYWN